MANIKMLDGGGNYVHIAANGIGTDDRPLVLADNGFTPSSYSAAKSATTTVTGQSEAVASGATTLSVVNEDATNFGLVAFGTSAANAETNAANGVPILKGTTKYLGIPSDATHYAWLGDTGTVILHITQGI